LYAGKPTKDLSGFSTGGGESSSCTDDENDVEARLDAKKGYEKEGERNKGEVKANAVRHVAIIIRSEKNNSNGNGNTDRAGSMPPSAQQTEKKSDEQKHKNVESRENKSRRFVLQYVLYI
jgi:hypothetical protein